jgi:hypothetical protein
MAEIIPQAAKKCLVPLPDKFDAEFTARASLKGETELL